MIKKLVKILEKCITIPPYIIKYIQKFGVYADVFFLRPKNTDAFGVGVKKH